MARSLGSGPNSSRPSWRPANRRSIAYLDSGRTCELAAVVRGKARACTGAWCTEKGSPGTTNEERLTCRSTGALQVLHLGNLLFPAWLPGTRITLCPVWSLVNGENGKEREKPEAREDEASDCARAAEISAQSPDKVLVRGRGCAAGLGAARDDRTQDGEATPHSGRRRARWQAILDRRRARQEGGICPQPCS
jgi:hypothetical protein